jgi:hypothetical protein
LLLKLCPQQTLLQKCLWPCQWMLFFGWCDINRIDSNLVTSPKEVKTVLVPVTTAITSEENLILEMMVMETVDVID